MPKKLPSTISGITFAHARRVADFYFEEDLLKIEVPKPPTTYDMYVIGPVNPDTQKKIESEVYKKVFRIIPITVDTHQPHCSKSHLANKKNCAISKKGPSSISGLTLAQAKKAAEAEFGDSIFKIALSPPPYTYEVYIANTIDKDRIESFRKAWNNSFSFIRIKIGKSE